MLTEAPLSFERKSFKQESPVVPIIRYSAGQNPDRLQAILGRGEAATVQVRDTVRAVLDAVRTDGDAALVRFTREFDGVDIEAKSLAIPMSVCRAALDRLDLGLREAMEAAAANIRRFHEHQRRTSWFVNEGDGVILGKRYTPVDAAGIYIPGGTAPLFSSVLMAAIPARVAGVERIVAVTPPGRGDAPHPAILAAAALAGVDEVYRVGGAQGIAALAYGTETIRPVDVIAGPGNAYVQEAKKEVYGIVGIDMVAGPSEIVVIADSTANPAYIAADMLSQAEHGSGLEAAIAIVTGESLAQQVAGELQQQTESLLRNDMVERALREYGAIFVVDTLDEACELASRIAAEHVEIQTEDPWSLVDRIRHAGAIFLGNASAEPVGDYYAGTNHILPTGGAARFASSVGVDDFIKSSSLIAYSDRKLRATGSHIVTLAEAEGLDAHARSVSIRSDR
jgi:histidinol dehydrogenase